MASLKAVQKKVPGADTVAGRVIAHYQGKHVDLGQYVGDDAVVLSPEGESIMSPPVEVSVEPKNKRGRAAVNENAKQGVDLSTLEV